MDIGTVRGVLTLLLMGAFIALVVWLFVFRSSRHFDEAARLALDSDDSQDDEEKEK